MDAACCLSAAVPLVTLNQKDYLDFRHEHGAAAAHLVIDYTRGPGQVPTPSTSGDQHQAYSQNRSDRQHHVVDVVIELGDERFGAPGRQFAAGTADALRSYPSAGGRSGLHALVQQRRR